MVISQLVRLTIAPSVEVDSIREEVPARILLFAPKALLSLTIKDARLALLALVMLPIGVMAVELNMVCTYLACLSLVAMISCVIVLIVLVQL